MKYVTIEAEISDGKIIPSDGTKLPAHGRALVTLLPNTPHQINWEVVEATLGTLRRPNLDSTAWQNEVRREWDRD